MTRIAIAFGVALVVSALAVPSQAALITFTGGTVYRLDSTTETTDTTVNWDNVDYYEEAGFRIDFIPDAGSAFFASNIGNYSSAGNDVIHVHWATGDFGGVTAVEITQINGDPFDINYFDLTSNTDTGGAPASGNELAWVEGFLLGNSVAGPFLLPQEDWGFPATQVGLGAAFDNVDMVRFYVTNPVDCFGMDQFFINEVPEPTSLGLLAVACGLVLGRRRMRRR